jgi:hypothetical protein
LAVLEGGSGARELLLELGELGAGLEQALVTIDPGQGFGLGFEVGADVLSPAVPLIVGGMDQVEVFLVLEPGAGVGGAGMLEPFDFGGVSFAKG